MDAPRKTGHAALVAAVLLVFTGLSVYGFVARPWRPPVATVHGHGVDGMITYLMAVTGVFFVAGHFFLAWLIWRGARNGGESSWALTGRAEWISALVPVVLMSLAAEGGVIVIGMPVWKKIYGPPPPDALQVEVVGKQFEWIVRYPGKDGVFGRTKPSLVVDSENPLGLDETDPAATDDVVVRGALRLPVGRAVNVRLRSHDVLHSFTIPEFRTKQDVVPGLILRTRFTPDRTGRFELVCTELCGMYHYRMRGIVLVTSPEEFHAWLDRQPGWFE